MWLETMVSPSISCGQNSVHTDGSSATAMKTRLRNVMIAPLESMPMVGLKSKCCGQRGSHQCGLK